MRILVSKTGEKENIFNDRDFVDFLRKTSGDDAAQYYIDKIADVSTILDDLRHMLMDADIDYDIIDDICEGIGRVLNNLGE